MFGRRRAGDDPYVEHAIADPRLRDEAPYRAEGADEAVTPDGRVRAHYRGLMSALREVDLRALESRAAAAVKREGIVFRNPVGDDPFRLDAVPRIFEREEWQQLARGIEQRIRALNQFVADVYGERRIVDAGRIPSRVIDGAAGFEPDASGLPVPRGIFVGVAGLDVIRTESGELRVLEDNLRTPSGSAYAVAARRVVDEILPFGAPPCQEEPSLERLLGDALRAAAPDGRGDPSIVLLTDGPANSAWWEHVRLAKMLGIPLATPRDVELRRGTLVARVGPDRRTVPVDVVYRRTDEDRLRDARGKLTWVAELLLEACRRGRLACVNAFGAGIADDKLVHSYVEEMIRFYLGEEPLVSSVPTYDPGEPSARDAILGRMDELVVKPRDGYGGDGVVVCPHANLEDRRRAADQVRMHPERFVAQDLIRLSTHPTVAGGALQPRHVDLRPFVFYGAEGPRALPGGLTRVALTPGALVVNSSQNGGGKATWVLA